MSDQNVWKEEDVTTLKEEWGEYQLANGTRVRVKAVLKHLFTERTTDGDYVKVGNDLHVRLDVQLIVTTVDGPAARPHVAKRLSASTEPVH